MSRQNQNTWLDQDSAQVDTYLSTADVIIVERNRAYKILMDLFRYHFERPAGLTILDLGCGDGILTRRLHDRYPDNRFVLMDGSPEMLEKAQAHLKGDNVSFRRQTFEAYIASPVDDETYDFVHSANAIHHLDLDGKGRLFARVYAEMREGGLFIMMDPVQPTSERSERWQFRMWVDWMNETLAKRGFRDDVGGYDHIPALYKSESENKPSTLGDQLDLLSTIGFKDVDCFYKYGVFSVFGGTK